MTVAELGDTAVFTLYSLLKESEMQLSLNKKIRVILEGVESL
jgi:hypothetical protein